MAERLEFACWVVALLALVVWLVDAALIVVHFYFPQYFPHAIRVG